MQPMQMLPPIENWGWSKKFEIIWMTLPEVAKALSILKHCSCKRGCKGRCICRKIELPCSVLDFASARGNVVHEVFSFEAYVVTTNIIFLFDILFVMI